MSNIPKLRFPEFKGEWEEKRIDSLSLINPKPGDLPEVFSYIDLESVKNGVLLQEKIIKKEEAPSRAQRLLEEKEATEKVCFCKFWSIFSVFSLHF